MGPNVGAGLAGRVVYYIHKARGLVSNGVDKSCPEVAQGREREGKKSAGHVPESSVTPMAEYDQLNNSDEGTHLTF